jgi:orotate phosphoribosyltransferase
MPSLADEIVSTTRRLVALQLWQLGAIKVNLDEPFRLVSGNYSPIYINCRLLISFPAFADLFAAATRLIVEHRQVKFDVVAGGETAGIPFAAFVARAFGLPMMYVRKELKGHGLPSRVEGSLQPQARVILVEDLITDAGSKISFVQGIRNAGGVVGDVLVVFDRLQGGRDALEQEGVRLHAMTDMEMALSEAEVAGLLSREELDSVRSYLVDPKAWHSVRGLPYRSELRGG